MDVIRGKVRKGKQRGRLLGFPTANINLHKKIPEGIYLSYIIVNGHTYPSLTFIGSAKTFGEKDYQAEAYILNFNQQIYDQWVSIQILKKIRGNIKFDSEKALIQQMQKDKIEAEEYFSQQK